MSTLALPHPIADPAPPPVLPLENGDRLQADEFRRRYSHMPRVKKAELIGGIVYMPSPVRLRAHGQPHGALVTWLGNYWSATPHLHFGDNTTTQFDDDNEPQPDGFLAIDAAHGGQSRVVDDYLTGAPELVAEVSSSTVSYDLHQKKKAYADFGVREYLVWRVLDREIDWWKLRDGAYERLPIDVDHVIRSEVFPGLWLAPLAMVTGDLRHVLAVLGCGLAHPSHAEFVARLGA